MKQPAYQSNEFQFFQQGVGKFIFPGKFKWGSFFCDSRSKIDISETSLKLFKKKKHLRDVDVSQTCVSSEMELILARIGLFGDYEGRDFTMYLKYRAQLGVRFRPSGS